MNRKPKHTALHSFCAHCIAQHLPYAVYRLPGETTTHVVAQQSPKTHWLKKSDSVTAKGFIVAPFNSGKSNRTQLIVPDIYCEESKLATPAAGLKYFQLPQYSGIPKASHNRKSFIEYVNTVKQHILEKHFTKAVAARSAVLKHTTQFNPVKLFKQLCKLYPDAFVYLLYTKNSGMWLGATPEVLLQYRNKTFLTYSLAGTRLHKKQTAEWGTKEKEEQTIVTKYIENVFHKFSTHKLWTEAPVTHRAGHLEHIRTTIRHSGIAFTNWKTVVEKLHPTPAVAGLPKQKALRFIQNNETTQRSLYSGYLGPVNLGKHKLELFVNLRCMRVYDKHFELFAGCGITSGSVGYKEWDETNHKMETLIRLL